MNFRHCGVRTDCPLSDIICSRCLLRGFLLCDDAFEPRNVLQ